MKSFDTKNSDKSPFAALVAAAVATAAFPMALSADNTAGHSDSSLWDAGRPDSHAPIGVMGEHTHEAGEFMFSYRYMYMDMEQSHLGDSKIGDSQIILPPPGSFMVTPTKMNMEMHMTGFMYAPSDELTLMLMVPHASKEMEHLTGMGTRFTTRSRGWGDLKVSGLWKIHDANRQRVHLNLGFSAPTGSTSETDRLPTGAVARLPYPMQTGSGTWDLLPGITYLGQSGDISWGAQALGTIRLGRNDEGYTLGDSFTGNAWGAYRLSDSLSLSSRLALTSWGNIDGADNFLTTPATAVPTADPTRRGGTRLDYAAGLNIYLRKGPLKGYRFALEAGVPVYQRLAGPQLGTEWFFIAGLQKAF